MVCWPHRAETSRLSKLPIVTPVSLAYKEDDEYPSVRGSAMKKTARNQCPADTSFRIGDAYIWSEIRYLDSTTNYRESIAPKPRHESALAGDLVMLDNLAPFGWVGGCFTAVSVSVLVWGVSVAIRMLFG